MSNPATLPDTPNTISSPASAFGPTPCDVQAGPIAALFGQALAHANLSARQAKELGLLTSGTCGPRSTISSASAALTSSLASRLQAKTASLGSTLYRLTWKERTTPAGRSIPALRASVRRTSDNDFIGWPTTTAALADKGVTTDADTLMAVFLAVASDKAGDGPNALVVEAVTTILGTPITGDAAEALADESHDIWVAVVAGHG